MMHSSCMANLWKNRQQLFLRIMFLTGANQGSHCTHNCDWFPDRGYTKPQSRCFNPDRGQPDRGKVPHTPLPSKENWTETRTDRQTDRILLTVSISRQFLLLLFTWQLIFCFTHV